MAVRIASNIASLQAQRQLSETSSTLSKVFQRLSSGARINSAGDDAAGLAIASSLDVGRRVFSQGLRNLNDGISALAVADSAIGNLSGIVTRIRELAEEAANGTFSSSQRKALDAEAQALQKEYFRISRGTSFNGIRLLDGSLSSGLRLQGGFDAAGSIQSSLGGVMGDGTFSAASDCASGGGPDDLTLGDMNGDGVLDMVSANRYESTVEVLLGRGDGTFSSKTKVSISGANSVELGDLNNDGILDLVSTGRASELNVLIGRGDGTFSSNTVYSVPSVGAMLVDTSLGDLNGDGVIDMAAADAGGDGSVFVFIGNGDGTFTNRTSYSDNFPFQVALADVNGDARLDMVTSAWDSVNVFLGQADGTFSQDASYSTGQLARSLVLGDLNGDGKQDIVTVDMVDDTVSVLLGGGDGTFSAREVYSTGDAPQQVALGDLNGDGVLDMVTADYDSYEVSVFLGKGDGKFSARTAYTGPSYPSAVAIGDLNGDGVFDIAAASYEGAGSSISVFLGHTRDGVAPLVPFSLTTQAGALQALAPLDRKIAQLSAQRGILGAFQSRLGSAVSTLQSSVENYAVAEARIRDADLASDTAELARLQISQQAATAVLAQANTEPQLALKLLSGKG